MSRSTDSRARGAHDAAAGTGKCRRTCVVCRAGRPRGQLLRYVADDRGRIQPDPGLRRPGHGVYTCADARCILQACARGSFARALGRKVAHPGGEELARRALAALENEVRTLLARGSRDGRIRLERAGDPPMEPAESILEIPPLLGENGCRARPVCVRLGRRVGELVEQVRRLYEELPGCQGTQLVPTGGENAQEPEEVRVR